MQNKNKQRREVPRLEVQSLNVPTRVPDVQFSNLNKSRDLTQRGQVQYQSQGHVSSPTSPPPDRSTIGLSSRIPHPLPVTSPRPENEEETGYNSGDEHVTKHVTYSEENEKEFRILLKERKGFEINEVCPDGACLFRSVSDQV